MGLAQSLKSKNWSQNWTKSIPKSLEGVWQQQFLLKIKLDMEQEFPKTIQRPSIY